MSLSPPTTTVVSTLWRQQPGLGRAYGIISLNTGINGALLLAGGDDRVSGRAYAMLRQVGNWPAWGMILLGTGLGLGGIALLRGRTPIRLIRTALIVAAIIDGLLGLWVFIAASHDGYASYLGASNYFTLALWLISQSDAYGDPPL